jgi:bacillithiol biosynthesis cysteine-adding enzyme BshC
MLEELLSLLGPPGPACDLLADLIKNAYLQHPTIASATFYLVNELFGQFGLIIVDPDDADLKRAFLPVMEDELLHQSAYPIVTEQIAQLGKEYKIQANPRDINLFYLSGQVRERIERKGATWHVLNTEISWTEDEVIAELRNHPERFSPNVVLRALFQETILPDVAFIGGGAEVAYWLQLKTLFERFNVYYPAIVLRQSVQLLNNDAEKLMRTLNLTYDDLFKNADELCKQQVLKSYSGKLLLDTEKEQLSSLFDEIARKASIIDPTLKAATAAVAARNEKQVARLEKKLLNAAKKQESVLVNRIHKLKSTLFPGGGLQERTENFAEPFLEKGHLFTESLYNAIEPFRNELLILKME